MRSTLRCPLHLCIFSLFSAVISQAEVSRHACFNNVLDIQCEASEIIVFDSARYGRNNTQIASRCGTPFQRNCDVDAHFTLNRLCAGQQKCALVVNTQLFGDPCGYEEFLTVIYKCVPTSSIQVSCQSPGAAPFFDHGFIASPNYPHKYYMDAQCLWNLAVQPRQTIKVTIYDFELDVKRGGQCYDYFEIETRGQSAFKDCGALGKQSITVDSNTALVRFKTGQSSLTQRGFFIYFEAVGPGCPDLSIPGNGTVVYRMFNGELTANVTCHPGFVFAGGEHSTRTLRCMGSEWDQPISSCIGYVPTTTSLATTGISPTGPNILTSEANDLVKSGSIIGIALGVVSALLLITLLLVLSLYLHRRYYTEDTESDSSFPHLPPDGVTLCFECHPSSNIDLDLGLEEDQEMIMRKKAERKLDQMRVVFNNLQENAINDECIQQVMDASLNLSTPTNSRKGKKKKIKNYKEDDLQGRNLLSTPYYVDDDDYDSPKDIMSDTYMKYPMIIDDTYKSVRSHHASRTGKQALCRSRDSFLDGVDSAFDLDWDEYDVANSRPRMRPSRTRSGIWDNKSIGVAMVPRVATSNRGGRLPEKKTFTQSAPDIMELMKKAQEEERKSPVYCPVHSLGQGQGQVTTPDGEVMSQTYFSPSQDRASRMGRSSTIGAVHGSHRTIQPKNRSNSRGRVSRC